MAGVSMNIANLFSVSDKSIASYTCAYHCLLLCGGIHSKSPDLLFIGRCLA